MNADIKARWVEALRGGKYRQGYCYLQTAEGAYCCLGVLCDVVDPTRWGADEKGLPYFETTAGTRTLDYATLPLDVRETAGLSHSDVIRLISLNDADELSFALIADHVEATL